jgi:hypothetical protein
MSTAAFATRPGFPPLRSPQWRVTRRAGADPHRAEARGYDEGNAGQ